MLTGVCTPLQEWNISRGELDVLSALGLLSAQEVERSIVSAWNPVNGVVQHEVLGKSVWSGHGFNSANLGLAVLM